MRVREIRRYPVKSMLGESVDRSEVTAGGLVHDRGLALIDTETGLVATAKHPRLWRALLRYRATVHSGRVRVSSPDGWIRATDDPRLDELLSRALGRCVRLTDSRPERAAVERPDPQEVIEHGVTAQLSAPTLQIGQGTPAANFVDHSPVHVITSATLESIGADRARYRPNIVIETPRGTRAFIENDWVGRELLIAASGTDRHRDRDPTILRLSIPTPRCAVPTLEHGDLPLSVDAVRTLLADNRVDVPGFGVLPCAGGYAEVLHPGAVHIGDTVVLR